VSRATIEAARLRAELAELRRVALRAITLAEAAGYRAGWADGDGCYDPVPPRPDPERWLARAREKG
jgi:hypothetical protein